MSLKGMGKCRLLLGVCCVAQPLPNTSSENSSQAVFLGLRILVEP